MGIFRRPLLPCLLAYVAGLWLVHEAYHEWPAAALALFGVATGICGALARRRRDVTPILLLLIAVAGASVMMVRERRAERAEAVVAQLDPKMPRAITGTVRAATEMDDAERLQLTLADVRVTSGGRSLQIPGKMLVHLERHSLAARRLPVAGERVSFAGHIHEPTALQNFFGYDRLEALRHREIYSVARPLALKAIAVVDSGAAGLSGEIGHWLTQLRRETSGLLARHMWQREARLMTAMLFNDMRAITDEEATVFRDSGTFHLFAVSGMHVAILGLVLGMLFRSLRFGVRGAYIGVAIVLFFYLWVIGFVPSATRAYLMLLAFTASHLLRQEVEAITSLVFAAAVVIAYDPAAPWNAGLLLSIGGVAGIAMFVPLMRLWVLGNDSMDYRAGFLHRMRHYLMDGGFAVAGATIMLFPMQVWLFGYWNALSVPANLLQGGLSAFALSAGILTAVAGFFLEPAAQAIGATASVLMAAIYEISEFAAEAYWALFYFRQMPVWLLFATYAILFGGYYLAFRDTPEFRFKSRARFAAHATCGLGLLLGFQLCSGMLPGRLEIWAINVGQGDSTLVRLPDGKVALIDGGRSDPDMGKLVVVPQIRALGIQKIDYMVATHDDDDHTGGLAEVIRRIPTMNLLLPRGFEAKSKSSRAMLAAAGEHGCVVQEVGEGFTAESAGCKLAVLNPATGDLADADNENSVVLRVDYGQFSALLMGDAGLPVESRLVNRITTSAGNTTAGVTLLKLGHHGSKTASGEEFIQAIKPVYALVSCGANNRFRHPAADVVERVDRAGAKLLRTDRHGALRISTDGVKVDVESCAPGK